MNTLKVVLPFCLFLFLCFSCSSDDKDPEVVFNSLNATKTVLYTEDKTTITIDGTGYTESSLTTSNPYVKITKVTSNTFEVSSTKGTTATIYAEIKNNSYNKMQSITLNFAEHGVVNFNTVEGITRITDKTDKILKLLGEPDDKIDLSSGQTTNWNYPKKGLTFIIDKMTSTVIGMSLYSSNFYYFNSNNTTISFYNYAYGLGNGWYINNLNTTMDMVVNKFGTPTGKSTSTSGSSTLRMYQFSSQRLTFRFYSDSEDNFAGKKIVNLIIY
jgi:hypothetical protein